MAIATSDVVRSYFRTFESGGVDAAADFWHPDIEWRAIVEEILFEADDRVAVAVRNSGRGRASGAAAEGRYYIACVVGAGRIVTGREYATREQALEAVRLLT